MKTMILILGLATLIMALNLNLVAAIDSDQLDELCSQNGAFLYRIGGLWRCGTITPTTEGTIINNITNNITTTITYNLTNNITNNFSTSIVNVVPSSFRVVNGTVTVGNNVGNLSYDDGQYMNITEGNGADNSILLYVNFTNVSVFSYLYMQEMYMGGIGHEIYVEVYDCGGSWESYGYITDQSQLVVEEYPILDYSNHICSGTVQVRLRHSTTGVSSHYLTIDYINLQSGINLPMITEHDALSGRDNIETNHPNIKTLYVNKSNDQTGGWTNTTTTTSTTLNVNMSLLSLRNITFMNSSGVIRNALWVDDGFTTLIAIQGLQSRSNINAEGNLISQNDVYTSKTDGDIWAGTPTQGLSNASLNSRGHLVLKTPTFPTCNSSNVGFAYNITANRPMVCNSTRWMFVTMSAT